jgi:hypothetical protein
MPQLGILFNIDELGGMYGYEAYKIFFNAVDTSKITGCYLSDGDTNDTLSGRSNYYCIAVSSGDDSKIKYVKKVISTLNEKGLAPASSRFLDDTHVQSEPLVLAGQINASGEIINCKTPWVIEALKKSREKLTNNSVTQEKIDKKEKTEEEWFCPKCEKRIYPGDKICPSCKEEIDWSEEPDSKQNKKKTERDLIYPFRSIKIIDTKSEHKFLSN